MPAILELEDRLNWNLLSRDARHADKVTPNSSIYLPIPPQFFQTSARVLLIGTKASYALQNWKYGGRLTALLPVTPSATSDFNLGATAGLSEFYSSFLPLNRLKLIVLPDLQPKPYTLRIDAAKWHKQLFWEIWEYSGIDADTIAQQLVSIETKIDSLQP